MLAKMLTALVMLASLLLSGCGSFHALPVVMAAPPQQSATPTPATSAPPAVVTSNFNGQYIFDCTGYGNGVTMLRIGTGTAFTGSSGNMTFTALYTLIASPSQSVTVGFSGAFTVNGDGISGTITEDTVRHGFFAMTADGSHIKYHLLDPGDGVIWKCDMVRQ